MKDNERVEVPLLLRVANLFTLCSLIVTNPLLDTLGRNTGFFVANQIRKTEIYLLVFVLAVAVPTAFTIPLLVSGIFEKRFRAWVQTGLIFILVCVFTLQVARGVQSIPGAVSVAVSMVLAAGVSIQYHRNRQWAVTLGFLTPLVIVFPVLFFANQNVQEFLNADSKPKQVGMIEGATTVERKPPIIFIVLDEVSLIDILDANGDIDALRFPRFAELANGATWYENATTVWVSTLGAVPAILTGNRPQRLRPPSYSEYPRNLFSMLQAHYKLNLVEEFTRLRPPTVEAKESEPPWAWRMRILAEDLGVLLLQATLPKEYSGGIPSTEDKWGGFVEHHEFESKPKLINDQVGSVGKKFDSDLPMGRATIRTRMPRTMPGDASDRYLNFISSFKHQPKETLHFIHILFPHPPSRYLPSGKQYSPWHEVVGKYLDTSVEASTWTGSQGMMDVVHQRHRIQIAFADTLIGEVVDELKAIGLYDDSLIVLCADHGCSLVAGVPYRMPTPENFADVAFIPLIIKYPHQQSGKRDATNVETIDIVPTIRDVLGADVPWEFEGRSLIDPRARPRSHKRLPPTFRQTQTIEYTVEEYLRARKRSLLSNIRRFSLDDPRADLFRYGPGLELIGKPISALADGLVSRLLTSRDLGVVRISHGNTRTIPTHFSGRVEGSDVHPTEISLVFSVNGTIQLVAPPYEHEGQYLFDVVLPEEVFQSGNNVVELSLVKLKDDV